MMNYDLAPLYLIVWFYPQRINLFLEGRFRKGSKLDFSRQERWKEIKEGCLEWSYTDLWLVWTMEFSLEQKVIETKGCWTDREKV